jgi:hypothetical protein
MWCAAELDEEYIARMEDVLAVYEKLRNGQHFLWRPAQGGAAFH